MPILAHIFVPPVLPSPFLDTRSLALRTVDGVDAQPFAAYDEEWMILAGATGLGMPPREVLTQTSPGLDGGWLRGVQVGIREVFLPLAVASSNGHEDFLDRMDRLRSFMDVLAVADMTETDGTLELVATSAKGERYLRVVYSDGMQGIEGGDAAGSHWATHGLKLLAVDPYWHDSQQTVFQFTNRPGAPFLSTTGRNRWPQRITPSVSLSGGGLAVTVPGNVPVWPTVEITGPAPATTLTWAGPLDEATNVTIGAVGAGHTLILSTDPRRRFAELDGDEAWTLIGPAPRFGRLKPGKQSLGVAVPGAGAATAVLVRLAAAYTSAW